MSQDEAESAGAGEAKLPPPRRLKLSFDFEMLDMKKVSLAPGRISSETMVLISIKRKNGADDVCCSVQTDMNAVFKGIMKKTSVAAPARYVNKYFSFIHEVSNLQASDTN